MADQERLRPSAEPKARRDQVDLWFVRLAWIVAGMLILHLLQQAFTMKPTEADRTISPAPAQVVG